MTSQGEVNDVRKTDDGWALNQHGGTFHIFDRHDWDRNRKQLVGGKINALDIVNRVLRPLGADNPRETVALLVGERGVSKLDELEIALTGEDALRLQDNGLATPLSSPPTRRKYGQISRSPSPAIL